MFERFTKKARAVTVRARELAGERGDSYIGSEHLLLALAEPGAGLAADVLAQADVTPAGIAAALAVHVPGPAVVTDEDVEVLRDLGIDAAAILDQAGRDGGKQDSDAQQAAKAETRRSKAEGLAPDQPLLAAVLAGLTLRRSPGATPGSRDGHVSFSKGAKKALENSLREALQLGDHYIGTEHLLLGVLRQGGLGAELLAELGVDLDGLRRRAIDARPGAA